MVNIQNISSSLQIYSFLFLPSINHLIITPIRINDRHNNGTTYSEYANLYGFQIFAKLTPPSLWIIFSPYHFIYYSSIALYDLNHFGTYIFIHIAGDVNPVILVFYHFNRHVNSLENLIGRNTGKNKISLIQCFRSLRTGTDTDRRKRYAYRLKKAAFLRKCSLIWNYCKWVHL